jgi:hypothetical protein
MRAYHALLREIVRPPTNRAPRAPRLGDPSAYADLVRLQHRQPVAEVFNALRERLGDARFDALFDDFRAAMPPAHPHPARWMRAFADHVGARDDLDPSCAELADLAATRLELALDASTGGPFGAVGALRAYAHDPRREPLAQGEAPCTLLIARTRDGLLKVIEVDAAMVAAWGVLTGEVSREAMAARGVTDEALRRGEEALGRRLQG